MAEATTAKDDPKNWSDNAASSRSWVIRAVTSASVSTRQPDAHLRHGAPHDRRVGRFPPSSAGATQPIGRARSSPHRAGRHAPDLRGVFRNGAVAGEFSRARDIENAFPGPLVRRAIKLDNPLVGLEIGAQIG